MLKEDTCIGNFGDLEKVFSLLSVGSAVLTEKPPGTLEGTTK